ncbi:OPT family oligopeptide transporter [Mycobacterium sp. NPDC003449]
MATESPVTPATAPTLRELTVRGILLGGLITLVFTAANVYLGLKVGLTFATTIPAAVISMAILRNFANHSIVENNIVQTVASAAGTLSAIIFVLPGLVMVGWWTGFPYWITLAVCAVGGILGVMYSIPLRRALVTGSDLPYPEGVAAAEVLKVGDSSGGAAENRVGIRIITFGAVVAAAFGLLANLKVLANSVAAYFRVGAGGSMFGASLSLALIGVGHLIGMTVGVAMLVGLVISFGILLPIRTVGTLGTGEEIGDIIEGVFAHDVRFVGAGAIAVGAVWTLLKILRPIIKGITEALASARNRREGKLVELTDRDIPFPLVAGTVVVLLIPIAVLLWDFSRGTVLNGGSAGIIVASVIFVFLIGLVIAAVCGYMAGLIGSSNSPISGVGILTVLIAALVIKVVFGHTDDGQATALIAFTLFVTAVTFGVATISNDNLQDLKTGQLVGATPWKQQVALVIGVLFGSAIIPPVLNLMQRAFGFLGAPGATDNALAAPQAALISSLTKGVFGGDLDWSLIGLGAAIGVGIVIVDEILSRTTRFALPPLAVGMGMYLPMSLTLIIPLGSVLGYFYNKWADRSGREVERKKRLGVLLATGMIVGESLYGVVFAGFVAGTGNDDPFAIFTGNDGNMAQIVGIVGFVAVIALLYKGARRIAAREVVKD